MSLRNGFLFAGCAVALSLCGCGDSVDVSAYQSRIIDSGSQGEVLSAGAEILRREFGRVTVDREHGRIVSAPSEFTSGRDSGTARDLINAPSTMRRAATLRVEPQGAVTIARVRIDVERQDTARRATMQTADYRLTDSPGYTPIERDAATTKEQNAVWTRVKRDSSMERALLDELRSRFAPVSDQQELSNE